MLPTWTGADVGGTTGGGGTDPGGGGGGGYVMADATGTSASDDGTPPSASIDARIDATTRRP